MSEFAKSYLEQTARIAGLLDSSAIEEMVAILTGVKRGGGRLFVLGVGGGAGHASHAVCDFRKLAGLEAYAPTDNTAELTARINDDGWDTSFAEWLRTSNLTDADALLIFSVGGGNAERNVSMNLVRAMELAKSVGAKICAIVGMSEGFAASAADVCVVVPSVDTAAITPHTEEMQAVIWHLLVSHPALKESVGHWESLNS